MTFGPTYVPQITQSGRVRPRQEAGFLGLPIQGSCSLTALPLGDHFSWASLKCKGEKPPFQNPPHSSSQDAIAVSRWGQGVILASLKDKLERALEGSSDHESLWPTDWRNGVIPRRHCTLLGRGQDRGDAFSSWGEIHRELNSVCVFNYIADINWVFTLWSASFLFMRIIKGGVGG